MESRQRPSLKLERPLLDHPRLRTQRAARRARRRHLFRASRRILVLVAADTTALLLARAVLRGLRAGGEWGPAISSLFPPGFVGGPGAWSAWLLGMALVGAYATAEMWASPRRIFLGAAAGAAIALWQSIDSMGLVWLAPRWVLTVLATGVSLMLARAALWAAVIWLKIEADGYERILFVGDPSYPSDQTVETSILQLPGVASVGWLSEAGDREQYLGHPSAVWHALAEVEADTVVVTSELGRELFESVAEAAAVAGCRLMSVHTRGPLIQVTPRHFRSGSMRLRELTFPAARAGQDVIKRVFDLSAASLGVLVLSPALVLVAILIKLDSKGPVFFLQERVGHAGRIFRMWKFRTMTEDADRQKASLAHLNQSGDPRLFKISNDPRVTRVGATLRKWSVDELPQLFNVILGHMSLVGPRPFFESELADYDDHHFTRLAVKPGMTGLWQVKGRSSIVDFEEVVRLDRAYIHGWSLWLDLKILAATIPAVVRRTGAT